MSLTACRIVPSLTDSLAEFVACVQTHLIGGEKGEAADYLDHLFRALGHGGVREAGAQDSSEPTLSGKTKAARPALIMW